MTSFTSMAGDARRFSGFGYHSPLTLTLFLPLCDDTYTKGQGGEGPVKGSVPDRIKACLFEDLKLRKEEEEEKVYRGGRLLIYRV